MSGRGDEEKTSEGERGEKRQSMTDWLTNALRSSRGAGWVLLSPRSTLPVWIRFLDFIVSIDFVLFPFFVFLFFFSPSLSLFFLCVPSLPLRALGDSLLW